MGVFKNEVGRPSNEVLKTRKTLKIIIGIVIFIVCFVLGYFVAKLSGEKLSSIDNKTNKQQVDILKAQEILNRYVYDDYNLLVSENLSEDYKNILAVKKEKENMFFDSGYYYTCNELFGDKLKKIEDMHYELNIQPFSEYNKGYCTDYSIFYDFDSVNKRYKELFGEELNLNSKIIFETVFDGGEQFYAYSELKNGFIQLGNDTGGMDVYEEQKIYESYIENDELHIIFSYFEYLFELTENGDFAIYQFKNFEDDHTSIETSIKLEQLEQINDEIILSEKLHEIFETYENKLKKYEMILTKENGDYIFKSLNEVK